MNRLVESKLAQLPPICARHHVRRLGLFGSAARDAFSPATSDLDIVVEFDRMPPARHADSYFGLQEDLQRLFGVEVDLVEPGPIRNPYFREALQRTQILLYEAT